MPVRILRAQATETNSGCLKEKETEELPRIHRKARERTRLGSTGSRKEFPYAAATNKPTASPDLASKSWEGV